MLTLAEVTGTWTGSYVCDFRAGVSEVVFEVAFRQSGSRVTGTVLWSRLGVGGSIGTTGRTEIEGVVNGDVLSASGRALRIDATVDGDEMTGTLAGLYFCTGYTRPASFNLRRESSAGSAR